MKHWPILLGLALLAVAAALLLRRSPEQAVPVPAAGGPGETPAGLGPSGPGPAIAEPASPRKLPMGSLTVALEGEGSFDGRIVVLDGDERPESVVRTSGEGSAEVRFPSLKAGHKQVVFVPDTAHLPAAARVELRPDATASVRLRTGAAGVLRGTAVDSLQQPLPGVVVEVEFPGAFATSRKGAVADIWGEGRSGGFGRRTSVPVQHHRALTSDGRLRRSVTSDGDGEFELEAPPGSAVTVTVAYKSVRFSQACRIGEDNRILVPVVPEAPPPDPDGARLREAIQAALRQMALHPDASEAYAAELRRILHDHLDRSSVSGPQKEQLKLHVEAIGRPDARR